MDETTEIYIEKVSKPNSKSQILAIITLIFLCIILGACLVALQIKENRDLSDQLSKISQSKSKAMKLLMAYSNTPNSDSVNTKDSEKANQALTTAESEYKEKNYTEALKAYESAGDYFKKATTTLGTYNSLKAELNQIESALPLFESLGDPFPEDREKAVEPILNKCVEAEAFIDKHEFEQAVKCLSLLKSEFTNLESSLRKKNEDLETHWAETKKEHNKESYQVFISTYPHSKYIPEAKTEIDKIVAAEQVKKEQQELAEKKKQEELKKEQAIIAARKEKQAQELKQKMQLEQVVTVNFDDGSSYTGQLNLGKKPHGDGSFSYTNSNVYRGNWKDGLYHGEGSYEFYTGVTYKGQWHEGKRHGQGLVTWKNGDQLVGNWSNGLLQGKATYIPKQGIRKTLNFHEGEDIGKLDPESFMKQKVLQQERYDKKRLTSNQKRAFKFMKRLNDAFTSLTKDNPEIIFPDFPAVIPKHESYTAGRLLSRDAEKHEETLKSLYFEQKRYLMVTKNSLNKDELGDTESAEFGGYTIMTASLGVILDNSGSMTAYLPKLRKKIQEKFKKSAFIEVTGCSLYKTDGEEIDEAEAMRSTVAAIKFLVNVKGADTIYWFSDLNDPQDEAALEELRFFFYKNLVTFYISSVGHKPSKELKNIIDESGGKVLRF